MRAAVLEAPGAPLIVYDDVELEAPRAGEVVVRVAHCGLCASDLGIVDGRFPSGLPIVLGHEAAGVVEEVGPGVSSVAPGDHVVLTPVAACGHCYWCVRGEASICANAMAVYSGRLLDGTTRLSRAGTTVFRGLGVAAFAERVLTPDGGAVRIPSDVALDVACTIGCAVQTGVGAVLDTARVEPGATVLVLGLGGIGLSVVQGARVAGATVVAGSDPVESRREAARRLGATHVLDPARDDVAAAALELTGGIGFDYAFEAAGRADLAELGLAVTRRGGTTVAVGAPGLDQRITIDAAAWFVASEKKLVGSFLGGASSRREIPRLVDLWRTGRLDLDAMVTSRRPLAEINEAFDELRAGRGVRTVVDC